MSENDKRAAINVLCLLAFSVVVLVVVIVVVAKEEAVLVVLEAVRGER